MDQIVLEPETKNLDARSWRRSLKFAFRLYSPGFKWMRSADIRRKQFEFRKQRLKKPRKTFVLRIFLKV